VAATRRLQRARTYDFKHGVPSTATDENGQITRSYYNGDSLRLSETDQPDGGVTSYTYSDVLVADANGNNLSTLKPLQDWMRLAVHRVMLTASVFSTGVVL